MFNNRSFVTIDDGKSVTQVNRKRSWKTASVNTFASKVKSALAQAFAPMNLAPVVA